MILKIWVSICIDPGKIQGQSGSPSRPPSSKYVGSPLIFTEEWNSLSGRSPVRGLLSICLRKRSLGRWRDPRLRGFVISWKRQRYEGTGASSIIRDYIGLRDILIGVWII